MNYKRIKEDECSFDEPLDELIQFRITKKEKNNYEVLSRENEISMSEFWRNLGRDFAHEYAISQDLKTFLQISNKLDSIFLKNRIISSRKASNLIKIREFLYDFEAFLDDKKSNISVSELQSRKTDFDTIVKTVFLADEYTYNKIKAHINRILKNKTLKLLDC